MTRKFSAEFKNEWSYDSILPYALMACAVKTLLSQTQTMS